MQSFEELLFPGPVVGNVEDPEWWRGRAELDRGFKQAVSKSRGSTNDGKMCFSVLRRRFMPKSPRVIGAFFDRLKRDLGLRGEARR